MLPQVFPLLRDSAAVTAIIGSNPVRCYRHGSAPQGVTAPYVTWYVVTGTPENSLEALPRVDSYSVQVDCWSDNTGTGSTGVETLAEAVRDAIEPYAYMTALAVNDRDPETMRYRIGMTFTFWPRRASTRDYLPSS